MSSVFFYEPFYDFERLAEKLISQQQQQQQQQEKPQQQHDSKGLVARQQDNSVDGAVRLRRPKMDLHENAEKNVVSASFEFPGVPKENIQIEVHSGRLTVSAETKQSNDLDENGYAVRERRFGKYSRTLQLPQGVKDDEIKATMENGVLTITFPRTIPELAPKRISIA